MLGRCFVVLSSAEEKKIGCFLLIVLWSSVFVSLPHGVMCWSVICGYGFSWSYSRAFLMILEVIYGK